MKIICIFLLSFTSIIAVAQETTPDKERKWELELAISTDIINSSYGSNFGYFLKVKRSFIRHDHFEILGGVSWQNFYILESDNLFTTHIKGYTRDLGAYGLIDIRYYPFKQGKFFMALEPFAGHTNLYSKGSIEIPQHEIVADYQHSYNYFNYGVNQTLGLRFDRFNIGAFAWLSLKGILDEGRRRPGDFDSRLFLGISGSFRL